MNYLVYTLICGIGATLVMDLWGIIRKSLFGIAFPDYSLVGRWLGHMSHGQFHHLSVQASPSVKGECLIGWTSHYLIGMTYASMLIGIWGMAWMEQPTLGPALTIGIGTVVAPFLLMQPGMGAGIAASRTPRPWHARVQSLVTHAVFGVGLYLSGWVAHALYPL